MTTHFIVLGSRVASIRVDTVECAIQLGSGKSEFLGQEDFRKNSYVWEEGELVRNLKL